MTLKITKGPPPAKKKVWMLLEWYEGDLNATPFRNEFQAQLQAYRVCRGQALKTDQAVETLLTMEEAEVLTLESLRDRLWDLHDDLSCAGWGWDYSIQEIVLP